jgi:sec-independent protein translocase protein TatA
MGTLSIWHILILGIVAMLLFGGRGKISDLMADVGKGVRSFRQGMNEPDKPGATSDRPASEAAIPLKGLPAPDVSETVKDPVKSGQ